MLAVWLHVGAGDLEVCFFRESEIEIRVGDGDGSDGSVKERKKNVSARVRCMPPFQSNINQFDVHTMTNDDGVSRGRQMGVVVRLKRWKASWKREGEGRR